MNKEINNLSITNKLYSTPQYTLSKNQEYSGNKLTKISMLYNIKNPTSNAEFSYKDYDSYENNLNNIFVLLAFTNNGTELSHESADCNIEIMEKVFPYPFNSSKKDMPSTLKSLFVYVNDLLSKPLTKESQQQITNECLNAHDVFKAH